MEIILAPNSALRNGRFASSPKSHVHDDFDAFCYNLQPVLDVNPRNSLRRVVSPTKTQKVAFPSQVKESSIQYFPTSVPSDSSPKKKHSKKSKLPTTGFGKSGQIQSRTGAKPLPFQKWTQSWWLHVYPATLNLFESEEKMNQWKAMHASDSTSTSTKGPINKRETANAKIKNKLLLASIDFDTEHNLEKKINSFEAREKGDLPLHDAAQHDTRDDISSKKIIAYEAAKKSTAVKFVMEDVRSKYYARNGPLMHTCKISYLSNNMGRVIEAAFGSTEADDLKKVRSVIRYCIRLVRKSSNSKGRKPRCAGGMSVISGMTKGAMSTVSRTEYGEGTMTKQAIKRRKKRRKTRQLIVS